MKRLLFVLAVLSVVPALAEDVPKPDHAKATGICQLIDAAAEKNGLPKPFFARSIWTESQLDIKFVGYKGVVQFMPATGSQVALM